MKSVAFFLCVFGIMMAALYLVVEDEPAPAPESSSPSEAPRGGIKDPVDLPIYDVQKGRLGYRLRGELPPDVFQFSELDQPSEYTLKNGELIIPVYEDSAASRIPGGVNISELSLRFAEAEYRELKKGRIESEEIVRLRGGGQGSADDGSVIEFEELEILIKEKYISTIRSSQPVSIRNSLLQMASPAGFVATFNEESGLERIEFLPPVVAFIDTRSTELLDVDLPGAGASREASVGSAATPGDDAAKEATRRIAITCRGPLVLHRPAATRAGAAATRDGEKPVEAPTTLSFEGDVKIFPIDDPALVLPRGPGPDIELPAPGATWFHCQRLALTVESEGGKPLGLSKARATWPGDRVRGSYEGFAVDGEELVWRHLGDSKQAPAASGAKKDAGGKRSERSAARSSVVVLTGRPNFAGDEMEFAADTASFSLDENRAHFAGEVAGLVRHVEPESDAKQADGGSKSGKSGKKKSEKRGGPDALELELPAEWTFAADEVDVVIAGSRTRPADAGKKTANSRTRRLDSIARFDASSETDGGLRVDSLGKKRISLLGRRLVYDGDAKTAALSGSEGAPPMFEHGKSSGSAETMSLLLAENLLRFEGDVNVELDEEEIATLRESGAAKREGDGAPAKVGETGKAAVAPVDPAAPAKRSEILLEGLRITADAVDVLVDDHEHIRSVTARGGEGSPVSLEPRRGGEGGESYRVEGRNLLWDNEREVAVMETVDGAAPRIAFSGGAVSAETIRFSRSTWQASLEGGVTIEVRATDPDERGSARRPLVIRGEMAEIEFHEWFRARGAAETCADELRTVKRMEAWAAPGERVAMASETFSAFSERVTWESAPRSLRLWGEGIQEFRRLTPQGPDILEAEEIVYRRADQVVELRRGVRGRFRLAKSERGGGKSRDGSPGLLWEYSTDSVELRLDERDDCRGLDLASLGAFGKILLECKSRGIRLRGDDLEYDHAREEVRIYSRDGRYQTLSQQAKPRPGADGEVVLNKIDSREIRLWYVRQDAPAAAIGERAGDSIVVRFFEDVTAAFFPDADLKIPLGAGEGDEWKLRANYLGLRIVPDAKTPRALQSAYAEGEVIFTSGDMKAMAKEAIYEESEQRLVLRGSAQSKVQLSVGGRTFSDETITLSQRGSRFRIQTKGRRAERTPETESLREARAPRP